MKIIKLICPQCGANLNANYEIQQILTCQYCGNKLLLNLETANIQPLKNPIVEDRNQHILRVIRETYPEEDKEWQEKIQVWTQKKLLWKKYTLGLLFSIFILSGLMGLFSTLFRISSDSILASILFFPVFLCIVGFTFLFISGGLYIIFSDPRSDYETVLEKRRAREEELLFPEIKEKISLKEPTPIKEEKKNIPKEVIEITGKTINRVLEWWVSIDDE